MIRKLLAIALILLAAPARAADGEAPAIVLHPGERVIVIGDGAGGLVIAPDGEAAELSDYDVEALLSLLENYAEAVGPNAAMVSSEVDPPPIAPDAVRISFVALSDGESEPQMLLMIENGFEREFKYRAHIAAGNQSMATDVCTVLPVLRGYEHWPYPFERIELRDFSLLPARPGEPPVCE